MYLSGSSNSVFPNGCLSHFWVLSVVLLHVLGIPFSKSSDRIVCVPIGGPELSTTILSTANHHASAGSKNWKRSRTFGRLVALGGNGKCFRPCTPSHVNVVE